MDNQGCIIQQCCFFFNWFTNEIFFLIFQKLMYTEFKNMVMLMLAIDRAFLGILSCHKAMSLVRKTWMFPCGGLVPGKQQANLLVVRWGFWIRWYANAVKDLCSPVKCRSYIFRCLQPDLFQCALAKWSNFWKKMPYHNWQSTWV